MLKLVKTMKTTLRRMKSTLEMMDLEGKRLRAWGDTVKHEESNLIGIK